MESSYLFLETRSRQPMAAKMTYDISVTISIVINDLPDYILFLH